MKLSGLTFECFSTFSLINAAINITNSTQPPLTNKDSTQPSLTDNDSTPPSLTDNDSTPPSLTDNDSTPPSLTDNASTPFYLPDKGHECTEEDFTNDKQCNKKGYEEIVGYFGLCVRFVEIDRSFNEARSYCMNHDRAQLVRIDDEYTDFFLSYFLRGTTRPYYWIGLTSFDEGGVFKWLNDRNEALWFNWYNDTAPDIAGPRCVVKDSYTGTWEQRHCEQKSGIICQRMSDLNPGRPVIEVMYETDAGVGFVGETLDATCWSYVPSDVNVNLTITTTSASVVTPERYSMYVKDHRFTRPGLQCLRQSNVEIKLDELTKELHNASVQCCWVRGDGFTRCAQRKSLEILFAPLPPTLDSNMEGESIQEGDAIVAICSGFVGEGGSLIWILSSPELTTEWTIRLDGSVQVKPATSVETSVHNIGDSFNGTIIGNISHVVVYHKTSGPSISSTFRTLARLNLHGANISCKTHMPGYDLAYKQDTVKTISWISVLSNNKVLSSKTRQHNGRVNKKRLYWVALLFLVICTLSLMAAYTKSNRATSSIKNLRHMDAAARSRRRSYFAPRRSSRMHGPIAQSSTRSSTREARRSTQRQMARSYGKDSAGALHGRGRATDAISTSATDSTYSDLNDNETDESDTSYELGNSSSDSESETDFLSDYPSGEDRVSNV